MSDSFFGEFTRRDVLRMGLASALGVSSSGWLPLLAASAPARRKQKACILLWMSGGPSQTDTFDIKPDHANGGPTKEIPTSVPGIRISEHRPRRESLQYPSLGALISKEIGRDDNELPNFVSVSPFELGPSFRGPGFLGPQYAPLNVSGDSDNPQARANLSIEHLSPPSTVGKRSLENRFTMLEFFQREFNAQFAGQSSAAHRANYERAVRMVQSQAKHAFELEEEPDRLRDAYGRNRFGQGCLLARRLVERGVPFVEVTLARLANNPVAWDTHSDNFVRVRQMCEVLDPAWSTLMTDLRDRGLLDSTLIIWMGEFGRTPQINPNGGRDHFPDAWSTVLAGSGVKGGQVIGDTGRDGQQVVDRPVTVPELYATICAAVGIDPRTENYSPEGRPITIVDEGGRPVPEIIA